MRTTTQIPACIERQVLGSLVGAVGSLFLLGVGICCGIETAMIFPLGLLGILLLGHAHQRYRMAIDGSYTVVQGRCTDIRIVRLSRRAKEMVIQGADGVIVVRLNRRLPTGIAVGTAVRLYLSEHTAIYQQDGAHYITEYLALEVDNRGADQTS